MACIWLRPPWGLLLARLVWATPIFLPEQSAVIITQRHQLENFCWAANPDGARGPTIVGTESRDKGLILVESPRGVDFRIPVITMRFSSDISPYCFGMRVRSMV